MPADVATTATSTPSWISLPGIPDVERSGVESTTLVRASRIGYTVFNGMGNFATYERAQAERATSRTCGPGRRWKARFHK